MHRVGSRTPTDASASRIRRVPSRHRRSRILRQSSPDPSLTVTPLAGASRIDLLVSSAQLGSDGSITLTALVKDAANNLLSGIPVSFAATSGDIQVTSGTTGPTGTATALLSTRGDPSNRTITVTATTGSLSSSQQVQVTGTTLSLSGATALVLNAPPPPVIYSAARFRWKWHCKSNRHFEFNTREFPECSRLSVTNATGQASFLVTATVAGTDTIRASALGGTVTATAILSISSADFGFTAPLQGTKWS